MNNNENIEVDINAFEAARYQEILNSGKYAELKILVGTEEESFEDRTGIMPCVRLDLHNASSETVGILYSSLMSFSEHLKKEYPLECLVAELSHDVKEVGSYEVTPREDDKKEKE